MRTSIEINGKKYKPAEFTFNNVCKLEEMGASLSDASNRSMSMLRAYLALCMNKPAWVAGKELEAHVIAGGQFDGLAEALTEALEESGFFQALTKKSEEEASPMETKKK